MPTRACIGAVEAALDTPAELSVYASRFAPAVAGAAHIAARRLRDKLARVAASGHWAPGTLFWTPPQLTAPTDADEVNSSFCHGLIFDFCGLCDGSRARPIRGRRPAAQWAMVRS